MTIGGQRPVLRRPGSGRPRTWTLLGVVVLAAALLTSCGGRPPADAAAVGLVVHGDDAVGIDSLLACTLRVVPAPGVERAGVVGDCTDPTGSPPDLQLALAPGTHVLQAGRFACPGMPGECSQDAYDEAYASTAALWSCEVTLEVGPREVRQVIVELTQDGEGTQCAEKT